MQQALLAFRQGVFLFFCYISQLRYECYNES